MKLFLGDYHKMNRYGWDFVYKGCKVRSSSNQNTKSTDCIIKINFHYAYHRKSRDNKADVNLFIMALARQRERNKQNLLDFRHITIDTYFYVNFVCHCLSFSGRYPINLHNLLMSCTLSIDRTILTASY
jgi:hypothetical protein